MTFLIISIVVFNLIAYLIIKRMTKNDMYITTFFALFFQQIVDLYLDVKLDWYGYFGKGVDWSFLLYIFVYIPMNIIILNYFPFNKSLKSKFLYMIYWSFFLTTLEWLYDRTGTFYHHQWKFWYSFFVYPFIISILAANLAFIKRQPHKKHGRKGVS